MPTIDVYQFVNTSLYKITVDDETQTSAIETSAESFVSGEIQGDLSILDGFLESKGFVTTSTGWRIDADGDAEFNSGTFRGSLIANSIDIPDTTTTESFHVESDGDTFWGATTFAGAVASVSKAGAAIFTSVTLSGSVAISGIANSTATDISLLTLTHNLVFSVTDADTIAWASGTINLANGRTFSIDSGNTGNMAALTYIYLDPDTSATVLQTTTTYSTAIGADKALIGTAQNQTITASFIPFNGGKALVDAEQIGALSIVAGNIAASTITSGKLTVSQLSAISADMGSITAGTIVLASDGFIRSGQTDFDTGTGWFIGDDGGTSKLSIGVAGVSGSK